MGTSPTPTEPIGGAARAALQAACDFHGLPTVVEVWPADPPAALARLRAEERCLGAIFLPPTDETVLTLLDRLDDVETSTGAADLAIVETRRGRRRLVALDCATAGVLAAFRESASYEPGGKRVVLLGAGDSTRSVAFALAAAEAASLAVWDPAPERAAALAAALLAFAPDFRVTAPNDAAALGSALAEYDLLVADLTPRPPFAAGEGGHVSPLSPGEGLGVRVVLPDRGLVCDLALSSETPLLAEARADGCQTLDGLTLLVQRVGAAFERLADKRAPLGLMTARARESLGS